MKLSAPFVPYGGRNLTARWSRRPPPTRWTW